MVAALSVLWFCPARELIRGEEAAFFHRYDGYLRASLEPRLLPTDCEAGERAEIDGEDWVCARSDDTVAPPARTVAAGDTVTAAASDTTELTVSCEEGQVAVASSINPSSADLDVSTEITGGDVTISVTNTGLDPIDVTPYAICAAA
ncbi:MAG TPA: hypothetical protein VJ938_01420 [Acidimicrobiia bacterium]|nr:hypothetical protein [Acidimicrobiia bacterium]